MAKNVTSADIFGGMFQNLPDYATKREEISDILDPMKFVGRAPEQVVEFVEEYLDPAIEPFKEYLGNVDVDLKV